MARAASCEGQNRNKKSVKKQEYCIFLFEQISFCRVLNIYSFGSNCCTKVINANRERTMSLPPHYTLTLYIYLNLEMDIISIPSLYSMNLETSIFISNVTYMQIMFLAWDKNASRQLLETIFKSMSLNTYLFILLFTCNFFLYKLLSTKCSSCM